MLGRRAVVLLLAAALLSANCASRRSHDDIVGAATGRSVAGAADGAPGEPGVAGQPGGDVAQGAGADTAATGANGAGGAGGASGRAGPRAAGAGGGTSGAAGSRPDPDLPPVRIGSVGTTSGVGGTQKGSVQALQAWAQSVNAKGGLAGHRVEVLAVDDGGDPARHRAGLQELVERQGVIAFVGNISGFSISQGAIDYLESKRVPVVGGDRLSTLWNESPMLFPQAAAGDGVIWVHMANTARLAGPGAPVGWITCQEVQICRDADRLWQVYAPQLGLEARYRAQVSVAQPNFTSECLRAQQAGVKFLLLGTDANSIRRIGASCAQQGYHPRFAVLQTSDDMAAEPGLDGGYFGASTFPWVAKDSAATREFQDAMARYAPGVVLSAHSSSGWVAAKLFERAAARLGATPATAQVLDGLWALRGETLGGITSPLTFERDKPAAGVFCYFPMEIRGGKWVATNGSEQVCRPPA